MTVLDRHAAREALSNLPRGASYGETPRPEQVYLPNSHIEAIDPDTMLVTGMRGAGKTFWWNALQSDEVRRSVGERLPSLLDEQTGIRAGFGIKPSEDYPGKDTLKHLLQNGSEPRLIWRTVQAWNIADRAHPLRQRESWKKRVGYVTADPERIDRLFRERDAELDRRGTCLLILFDALDRSADEWRHIYPLIRGLLQTALDLRSYRRLRVKVFLRSDQIDETVIADFPDASKVLSSAVELSWPRSDLYGLLWHALSHGKHGEYVHEFLEADLEGVRRGGRYGKEEKITAPRRIVPEEALESVRFHAITGPYMGIDRRRGFPYTWIPTHLSDAQRRVSPRSFLTALRAAAGKTAALHASCEWALHYESIKQGVQEASKIRVQELREDYPWIDRIFQPLRGITVPCQFKEIRKRWKDHKILDRLTESIEEDDVKLPPRHLDAGPDGVRQDLESLGIFFRMSDDRVNIPDVFRVGYGLKRRGGVRPVR